MLQRVHVSVITTPTTVAWDNTGQATCVSDVLQSLLTLIIRPRAPVIGHVTADTTDLETHVSVPMEILLAAQVNTSRVIHATRVVQHLGMPIIRLQVPVIGRVTADTTDLGTRASVTTTMVQQVNVVRQ